MVVQGVTPSIPINLKDVTRALVEGWKRDDAWPPKPGVLDPLVPVVKRGGDGFKGRTRGREAERVRVVQSERKGVESGRKSAETTLKDKKGGERGGVRKEEDTKQTGKVVGVVGKVKKVFGLGGSATTNSIFEETNSRPGNEAAVRELLAGEVEDEEAGEEEKMEAGAENKGIRNG